MSNDNTAVAICAEENGRILADVVCFIPEGRIDEKNKFEKLDYRRFVAAGKCIACGNRTIDYGVVEEFVFSIEEKYGVNVRAIGFDRYNAISSAQKWNQTIQHGRDSGSTATHCTRPQSYCRRKSQMASLSMKKIRC